MTPAELEKFKHDAPAFYFSGKLAVWLYRAAKWLIIYLLWAFFMALAALAGGTFQSYVWLRHRFTEEWLRPFLFVLACLAVCVGLLPLAGWQWLRGLGRQGDYEERENDVAAAISLQS